MKSLLNRIRRRIRDLVDPPADEMIRAWSE